MIFLEFEDALKANRRAIEIGGGLCGVRDENLLGGALARPQNLYYYENAELFELAACYAFAIAKNHPFLDGNKRTAFICMLWFLKNNNIDIQIETDQAVNLMLDIATDKLTIKDAAEFLKLCVKK